MEYNLASASAADMSAPNAPPSARCPSKLNRALPVAPSQPITARSGAELDVTCCFPVTITLPVQATGATSTTSAKNLSAVWRYWILDISLRLFDRPTSPANGMVLDTGLFKPRRHNTAFGVLLTTSTTRVFNSSSLACRRRY